MMGAFNGLIDNNKEPKKGVEYIYMLDMVWKPGVFESFPVVAESIVVDVEKCDDNSFRFKFKEGGDQVYKTNYGWSLAENTTNNLLRISEYKKLKEEVDKSKSELKKLRSLIDDLGEGDVFLI